MIKQSFAVWAASAASALLLASGPVYAASAPSGTPATNPAASVTMDWTPPPSSSPIPGTVQDNPWASIAELDWIPSPVAPTVTLADDHGVITAQASHVPHPVVYDFFVESPSSAWINATGGFTSQATYTLSPGQAAMPGVWHIVAYAKLAGMPSTASFVVQSPVFAFSVN